MARGLQLKKIGKRFGDFWAVRNVTCRIFSGKITGFIGPNGAGKTTLFSVITGDLRPDTGSVLLDGEDITGLKPWAIARKGIGKLYQDVRIFKNLRVIDNVVVSLLSPKEESPFRALSNFYKLKSLWSQKAEEAMKWLEFVGLADDREKKAIELSFGQQKLLSFARLMAAGFDILLLDEPTAGVHPKMIHKIEEILIKLVEEENKTIAIIEHNMSVIASLAYWVNFMTEGEITFSGRTDHVLGDENVRKIYMGIL